MANGLPVTVIGGYLGAGKTTLLNALLREARGVHLAVIVNDFGSIDVDAALITNRSGETISLANGCICCSIGDSLAATLHDLAARSDGPEHVVIEASGVAEIDRLARLAKSHPRLVLDSVIVVADAETIRNRAADRYVSDLVRRQLAAADIIVLSKTDLIGAEEQRQVSNWIAAEAPGARILDRSGRDSFTAFVLAGRVARVWSAISARPAAPEHSHEDHARLFATWSFCADRPLDGCALRAAIAALPTAVIRAKGIVRLIEAAGRRHVLQLVGRRWSLEPAPSEGERGDDEQGNCEPSGRSAIVCLGLAGQLDPARLDALFAGVRGEDRGGSN
jgi:G3E family GTPase